MVVERTIQIKSSFGLTSFVTTPNALQRPSRSRNRSPGRIHSLCLMNRKVTLYKEGHKLSRGF